PRPVIIIHCPRTKQPADLVTWYETSITHYLQEHTSDLTVFTPLEVAQMFAPPGKKTVGRKERAAAILALEQLAYGGVLCRHDVKGEMRYVNDWLLQPSPLKERLWGHPTSRHRAPA